MSCFISSLKPHIKREVLALHPINLTQAIALAKLQEDKYNDLKRFSKPTFRKPHKSPLLIINHPFFLNPKFNTNIKLTPVELQNRLEKGLYIVVTVIFKAISARASNLFSFIDGILYQKNRVFLSPHSALKSALLVEFHSTPTGGHVGTSKTYSQLSANFTTTRTLCRA